MNECIPWWGSMKSSGYGYFGLRRRSGEFAHRRIYEECFGFIPNGMIIHHTCQNVACVNPAHLCLTTNEEHPDSASGLKKAQTHCKNGHPFSVENTYFTRNGRVCKTCNAAKALAARDARRINGRYRCPDCGATVSRPRVRCRSCANYARVGAA